MGWKHIALLRLLLLLPITMPAAAQEVPTFRPEEVRAHVEFLADDLLEGRDAGSRGHLIATRYVASRFDALGLKPGAPGGSWYQEVPLAEFELDPRKPAFLTIGKTRFPNQRNVLIGASPRHGEETQTLSAGAVFAGFGAEADYAGLDAAGKFVVVLLGGSADKAAVAARHGALGLLYLVTPADLTGRFPWGQALALVAEPQTKWLDADGYAEGRNRGITIGAYLRGAAAEALFAGAPMTAAQVYAAAQAGAVRSFPLAQSVTTSRTSIVKLIRSPNVIGILPGSDPKLANEYVILSAHLDHVGTSAEPGGDRIFNGAMDNASGVATMLEAARAFAASPRRPRRSILFVALTDEEKGLYGSEYLANNPVTGSGRIVADVNLDMPILLYDFKDVIAFGGEHSTIGEVVAKAGAGMGVSVSADPMPEEQFFVRSDHYSFVQKGVPSIFLMTGFANGGEKAFRSFLATHYHKVSDDLSQPFNWQAGAKFAELNYRIAREIADADQPPRWYEGNVFGDRFAPGQARARKP